MHDFCFLLVESIHQPCIVGPPAFHKQGTSSCKLLQKISCDMIAVYIQQKCLSMINVLMYLIDHVVWAAVTAFELCHLLSQCTLVVKGSGEA